MNKWTKFISFLIASLFGLSAAHAGKENDTLVWVTKFEPPTYNYYDQTLREGIKVFSEWPTIPQLYIKKEFVGGCDIVKEMYESGELKKLFENKNINFKS